MTAHNLPRFRADDGLRYRKLGNSGLLYRNYAWAP